MRRLTHGFACIVALASISLVACSGGDGGGDDDPIVVDPDAGGDAGGEDAGFGADVDTSDECEFADDGVCDEPTNCALGTDQSDCRAACEEASGAELAAIGAACEYRGFVDGVDSEQSHYEEPAPSEGSSDLTGWRDEWVAVPSGEADASGDVARHFRVYVPPSYDPDKAYPVMINMPGHRVSHWILPGFTMLHRTAEANDFIAIFAGQEFRSRWAFWTEWVGSEMSNPPEFCRQQDSESNPDYEFLRQVVDWAGSTYNIDRRRIYTSGHSRGAAMAMMAALEMPEIAGAAVESGFTECEYLNEVIGDQQWEGRNVPLAFVHGVEDPDICINCEPGATCAAESSSRSCSPGMHASDVIVDRLTSIGWEEDDNLRYYRLERAAHDWQSYLNQQIWHFLASQPRPIDE